MKVKVTAEYKRRLKLILKSKFNGKNKIQSINSWAVALLRCGAGKTLTMFGVLHPKSDIDQLYLKRKLGGRGLISIEMCVRSEENNLGLYMRRLNEMLLKGIKKLVLSKLKILLKKKTSRKIAKRV